MQPVCRACPGGEPTHGGRAETPVPVRSAEPEPDFRVVRRARVVEDPRADAAAKTVESSDGKVSYRVLGGELLQPRLRVLSLGMRKRVTEVTPHLVAGAESAKSFDIALDIVADAVARELSGRFAVGSGIFRLPRWTVHGVHRVPGDRPAEQHLGQVVLPVVEARPTGHQAERRDGSLRGARVHPTRQRPPRHGPDKRVPARRVRVPEWSPAGLPRRSSGDWRRGRAGSSRDLAARRSTPRNSLGPAVNDVDRHSQSPRAAVNQTRNHQRSPAGLANAATRSLGLGRESRRLRPSRPSSARVCQRSKDSSPPRYASAAADPNANP